MTSSKRGIQILERVMIQKGVKHVVISPGSRNAPLAIAFSRNPEIKTYHIVDERSAAFFALGLAIKLDQCVALACTSGSAPLNYAPGIAEAFYREIPLLVLTADRPNEWIDQDESQTIRQKDLYKNFILGSYELPDADEDLSRFQYRIVNNAINQALDIKKGPVHINLPLKEPLYNTSQASPNFESAITKVQTLSHLSVDQIRSLNQDWNKFEKKMILTGILSPNEELSRSLIHIDQDPSVVILSETTSNLTEVESFEGTDKYISAFSDDLSDEFVPTLIITIGKQLISRKIKSWLRTKQNIEHWHIDESGESIDGYSHLSKIYPLSHAYFFNCISKKSFSHSNYKAKWELRTNTINELHSEYLAQTPYSDLKVFEYLTKHIPSYGVAHLGNSTPVRYFQLFPMNRETLYFSNRGTSGIDGSISTALGYSQYSKRINMVYTGDLSFFYDSNSLWNKYLKPNFKIVLINNSGGGIFRIIAGPSDIPELEDFFEVKQKYSAEHIAQAFGLNYFHADSMKSLEKAYPSFMKDSEKAAILEIETPPEENGNILNAYFKALKNI